MADFQEQMRVKPGPCPTVEHLWKARGLIHKAGCAGVDDAEDWLVWAVVDALAAGAEYVSLRDGDREMGRIYLDGREKALVRIR